MSPEDRRHGSEAGYQQHRRDNEPACDSCAHARMIAGKRRRIYGSSKVPALGSQRRIRALQALGHSKKVIATHLGYGDNGSISYLMRAETMLPKTAARIAAVYDELCMVRPEGPGAKRARTWAARLGYAPPLAWDDIDNDPAPARSPRLGIRWEEHLDEAMVARAINGGPRPRRLTKAETAEVVRRMVARGYGSADIERLTGIKAERAKAVA